LKKFNLDLIVRAHQVVEDGYEFMANRGIVTVFSASNYCGEFDNCGAVLKINKDLLCSFVVFKPSEKGEMKKIAGRSSTPPPRVRKV